VRKYLFIGNPRAGRGSGRRVLEDVSRQVASWGDPCEIVETSRVGEATEIAASTVSDVCVAVGGDGTINEVANGLGGTARHLAVVPAGSGNDFAKAIAVPASVQGALSAIRTGNSAWIDVGSVTCSGGPSGNQSSRQFVNGVGIGFDAAVAARTRGSRVLSGTLLYVVSVLKTLGRYRSPLFHISIDKRVIASRNLLIAIGNGICAGGGFYLTPQAKVDDGVFDICMVDEMPVPRILRLMPKVMKGKHAAFRGVAFQKGASVIVVGDAPFFVHADGEIVGEGVTKVEISLSPASLQVITGHTSGAV
jgi:YegS/Rv2252/BmrU family lipid kinase